MASSLSSATITVSSLSDGGAGSLRQAIQDAASGDTIQFPSNLVVGTITLTNGELVVMNDLTMIGSGGTNLTVSGNLSNRVLNISSNVTAHVAGLTFRDGHASDGTGSNDPGSPGGGILNAGKLTLTACTISGCSGGRGYFGGNGGGIYSEGTLTLIACTVSGNTGGLGSVVTGGNGGGIYNAGTLTLIACTVSNNTGGGSYGSWGPGGRYSGGGGSGGGIYNTGTLALSACTVSGNAGSSGGPRTVDGGYGGYGGNGGGVYNAGVLSLSSCTLSGNTGGSGGDANIMSLGGIGGSGGGIYNSGNFTLIACTLSGNTAGGGGDGHNGGNGGSGGGIYNAPGATSANLRSALVAPNSVGKGGQAPRYADWGVSGYGPDLAGAFASQGHNLIGATDGGTGFTNAINGDLAGAITTPLNPMLGPLTNNGGSTFTMALLPGSPALDTGDDALLDAPINLTTDQRGRPRKFGGHVDIGAFELQPAITPFYLTSPVKFGNGTFQFGFTSTPGEIFSLLATTNVSQPLSNWTVLGTPTEIAPGQFQFTDLQATGIVQRFYRVRSP